jgi:arsenate reductase (thioredoxin)
MGCVDECPYVRAKRREDWQIPDPKDMPVDEFRAIRDRIAEKVSSQLPKY